MAIKTLDDLRTHVALARQVEMSTIPPYPYAMYSIKDQKSDASCLIASIAVEEMLLALTTNLLLALGGEPDFGVDLVPPFRACLPTTNPTSSWS